MKAESSLEKIGMKHALMNFELNLAPFQIFRLETCCPEI